MLKWQRPFVFALSIHEKKELPTMLTGSQRKFKNIQTSRFTTQISLDYYRCFTTGDSNNDNQGSPNPEFCSTAS